MTLQYWPLGQPQGLVPVQAVPDGWSQSPVVPPHHEQELGPNSLQLEHQEQYQLPAKLLSPPDPQ